MFRQWRSLLLLGALTSSAAPVSAGDAFEKYGDIARFALPGSAFVVSALKQDWEGAAQLGISTGLTQIVVYGLKASVTSTRPTGGENSFPSSHAANAFSGAAYYHFRYGWEYGIPAHIAAAAVAWSRTHARKHYWTDVLAGAAVAELTAWFLVDPLDDSVLLLPYFEVSKPSYGVIAWFKF